MRHKLGDAFLDEDTTTNFKRVLKHGCTINEVLEKWIDVPLACL